MTSQNQRLHNPAQILNVDSIDGLPAGVDEWNDPGPGQNGLQSSGKSPGAQDQAEAQDRVALRIQQAFDLEFGPCVVGLNLRVG